MVKWKMRADMLQSHCTILILLLTAIFLCPVHTAERNEAYQEGASLTSMLADLPAFRNKLGHWVKSSQANQERDATFAGIVISGGAPDIFAKALLSIKMLRKELGVQLGIEVAYFQSIANNFFRVELLNMKKNEGQRFMADVLASALFDDNPFRQIRQTLSDQDAEKDVRLVDLTPAMEKMGLVVKPQRLASLARVLSVTESAFQNVIYLDADTLPLQNPGQILNWELFSKHGSLFWNDFHNAGTEEGPKEVVWRALGLKAPWLSDPDWKNSEQGCFVIDRRRHVKALAWANFLLGYNDVIYQYLPDYEDVWELAFALAGSSEAYSKLAYPPRAAMGQKREEVYDLIAVAQNSQDGSPMFVRRVGSSRFDLARPGFAAIQWLTVGLADAGWRAFAYQTDSSSFGIHDESTIYPHDADCDCVDKHTARLLSEKEPTRWEGCYSESSNLTRKLPVALLPVQNYPQQVSAKLKMIERAVTLFQTVMADRLRRSELSSSPDPKPVIGSDRPESWREELSKAQQTRPDAEPLHKNDGQGNAETDQQSPSKKDAPQKEEKHTESELYVTSIEDGEGVPSEGAKEELKADSLSPVERTSSRALSEGLRSSQRQARLQMRKQRTRSTRLRVYGS